MEYWGGGDGGGYHVFWTQPLSDSNTAAPLKYHVLVGGCNPGSRILIHTGWSSDFFRVVNAGGSSDNLTTIGVEGVNRAGIGPCVEVETMLPAPPDLVARQPIVGDTSLRIGEPLTLSVRVDNDGAGNAPWRPTLRYYRSTDDTITTTDTEEGEERTDEQKEIGALFAGESRRHSIRLTAPSAQGTYYYGACVDSSSLESDTTNNCSESVEVFFRN